MSSLRTPGGHVMIDHRASPGITEDFIRSCGKDPADFLVVGEGKMLEADTLTCSHCQRVVVLSPTRKRERARCAKCSRYICDFCEAHRVQTGECLMMRKQMEILQEENFLREQRSRFI